MSGFSLSTHLSTHYLSCVSTLPAMCQHTIMCQHTTCHVSAHYLSCVNTLPVMCRHTTCHVSTHYLQCVNTLTAMCQHTTTRVKKLSIHYLQCVNTLPATCSNQDKKDATLLRSHYTKLFRSIIKMFCLICFKFSFSLSYIIKLILLL